MMKLSRLLLSARKVLTTDSLCGNAMSGKCSMLSSSFSSHRPMSTAGSGLTSGKSLGRTFADYTVFKGKAALSLYPILPKFTKLDSGSSKVDKNGVVMLTFWPAVGTRKYDWEKKQVFALSPTEVGGLISLGPTESCEFFHDPSMKSSLEGQVKKTLSISPQPRDGGYFLNLSVMNSAAKTNERLMVPVTKAEFAVMRTALSYALPHLMGWDQALRPQQHMNVEFNKPKLQQQTEMRMDPDFEWGR